MAVITVSGLVYGLAMLLQINVTALPLGMPTLPAALIFRAFAGVGILGFVVSTDTLLQQSVTDRFRGRVFGAYGAWLALMTLVGQLLAGVLGDRVGIVPVLRYDGAGHCGGPPGASTVAEGLATTCVHDRESGLGGRNCCRVITPLVLRCKGICPCLQF